MGLISSAINAVTGAFSGVLADTWKDYFFCDAIPSDTLVVKGVKRVGGKSSNKYGNDNIITSGSGIAVADGQCMIIVDNGKVVEVCAEPGEYTYDASTEPSIFSGNLSQAIKDTFKIFGKRLEHGGDAAHDQRVYYFNTKEITDNKFGTANPIPFRVVDNNIGLDIDTSVRCNGIYSYRIIDPILFYTNVCGNVERSYTREEIDGQLRTEFVSALQPAFAKISDLGVRPSALPGHAEDLAKLMNDQLTQKWSELRGIAVVSVALNPVTIPDEDADMIKQAQREAQQANLYSDPAKAAAMLSGAQAQAMKDAANNSAGAMTGFMGMGMAQQAGGANTAQLFGMAAAQQAQQAAAPQAGVNGWVCGNCGTVGQGKFCPECGSPKPQGAPVYKCDKCGWMPEDPANPPKFCPECGDPFNEDDMVK